LDGAAASLRARLFKRLEQICMIFHPQLGEEACVLARKRGT